jgi:DNA-binding NtrC family response regulator
VYTSSVGEARQILAHEPIAMVICEDHLADGSFRDMLGAVSSQRSQVPVVVTAHVDDQVEYLEAMRLGAFDFIAAPYRRAEVEWILEHALHLAPSTKP